MLTTDCEQALDELLHFISTAAPRLVSVADVRRPVLVFGDGACEGVDFESVSAGALMIDLEYKDREFFGLRVAPEVITFWTSGKPGQTIGQAELLPIVMARKFWGCRFAGRRVFFFIDNDAARDGLIKGSSDSPMSQSLITMFYRTELTKPCWPWFARVSSAANPADEPSRLKFELMHELGAIQVFPKSPLVLEGQLVC